MYQEEDGDRMGFIPWDTYTGEQVGFTPRTRTPYDE